MSVIAQIEAKYRKPKVVAVRSGDTVRVHQRIKEGNKTRVQMFEGMVIRTKRTGSVTSAIVVRRVASGVGVEKSYLLHSPLIEKIEVTKRSKVRRNYLSYMRERSGKSARLSGVEFDRDAVNDTSVAEEQTPAVPAESETPAESKIDEADKSEKVTDNADAKAEEPVAEAKDESTKK